MYIRRIHTVAIRRHAQLAILMNLYLLIKQAWAETSVHARKPHRKTYIRRSRIPYQIIVPMCVHKMFMPFFFSAPFFKFVYGAPNADLYPRADFLNYAKLFKIPKLSLARPWCFKKLIFRLPASQPERSDGRPSAPWTSYNRPKDTVSPTSDRFEMLLGPILVDFGSIFRKRKTHFLKINHHISNLVNMIFGMISQSHSYQWCDVIMKHTPNNPHKPWPLNPAWRNSPLHSE